jgi:hypothetical protein
MIKQSHVVVNDNKDVDKIVDALKAIPTVNPYAWSGKILWYNYDGSKVTDVQIMKELERAVK